MLVVLLAGPPLPPGGYLAQMSSRQSDLFSDPYNRSQPLSLSLLIHFALFLFIAFITRQRYTLHLLTRFSHKTCLFQSLSPTGGQRPCLTCSWLCLWCLEGCLAHSRFSIKFVKWIKWTSGIVDLNISSGVRQPGSESWLLPFTDCVALG